MNDITGRTDTAPSIALLPSSGDNVPRTLARAGIWVETAGFGQLHGLAAAMTRGKQVIRLADVTALPDAWGQAVCFHAAFHHREHVLHDTAIAEWRGLLTLIALSQLRDVELRVVPVDLRALADNPRGSGKERLPEGAANFGAAVRDSFPNFIDIDAKDRLQIDVLLCGKEPVPLGFTFDRTLVVPGRDYSGAFEREAVPWGTWERYALGYPLRDPRGELSNAWEGDALRQWLSSLRDSVRAETGTADLIDELGRFIEDLGPPSGRPRAFQWIELEQSRPARRPTIQALLTVPTDSMSSKPGFVHQQPPTSTSAPRSETPQPAPNGARAASTAPASGGAMPSYVPASTMNLRPSSLEANLRASLRDSSVEGAIIVDSQWAQEWGDLKIVQLDNALLDSLLIRPDMINGILEGWRRTLREKGWLLLTPDDIFTPSLVSLKEPTKYHQTEQFDYANHYLLPFNPIVLALFDLNGLRKASRMSRDKDEVVVTLDVQLRAGAVTLSRRYREVRQAVPPVRLSQWPSFASSNWRHYYLEALGGDEHLRIARVIATDRLGDMIKELTSAPEATARVMAWGQNDDIPPQVVTVLAGGRRWRTCHLADRPIEAVTLTGVDGLCLAQPIGNEYVQPVESEFDVAVDFGSSGTQILATGGGRVVRIGPLESQLSFIFGEEDSKFGLPEDLMSKEGATLFVSSLAKRPGVPLQTANEWKAPRTLSFIPLPNSQALTAQNSLKTASGANGFYSAQFGLKYGCRIDNVAPAEDQWEDIESLMRECALFAAASVVRVGAKPENIRWAFAYPATFLATEKKKFDALCKAATIVPGRSPAMDISEGAIADAQEPLMVVEPRATYLHLRHTMETRIGGIMISADVGGHSTDICISCGEDLVWAGSLAIAGQHVFTDHLVFDLPALQSCIPKELGTRYKADSEQLRSMAVGNDDAALMVLRGFVEAIFPNVDTRQLKKKDKMGDPAVRLFLFGLIEYLRLILERCRTVDKTVGDGLPVSLQFAGGGARFFFDWIGQRVCENEFNNAISSLPWSGKATQVAFNSKKAKMEVAEGLLAALKETLPDVEWKSDSSILDQSRLPLGEKVKLGSGRILDCLDVIPTSELENPGNIHLLSIECFEELLAKAAKNGIPEVRKVDRTRLLNRTSNAFAKEMLRGRDARMIRIKAGESTDVPIQVQPPFILALRACIEIMVRP